MSDSKKYYYLKLKETFFDNEEMKLLESQKNGVEYQNFYLKLCLLSLKNEGKLMFKDTLPYDLNMLSTILRVNIDTVKTGIELFEKLQLVKIVDTGEMFMTDIQSLAGHGSTEAERKAEYRKKLQIGTKSGQSLPELELDIEKETEKEKKKAEESALFTNLRSFFTENNHEYYHDGKQAKAIKLISRRGKTWDTILPLLNKFMNIRNKERTGFWNCAPLTPAMFYSVWDSIVAYQEDKPFKPFRLEDLDNESI